MIPVITTGDNISLQVTLKKDGSTFNIDSGATVQASIIDKTHKTVLAGPITQSNATAGADWANSLVIVEFSPTDTSSITYQGEARLEIQVDDSGKTTFFADISILLGTI